LTQKHLQNSAEAFRKWPVNKPAGKSGAYSRSIGNFFDEIVESAKIIILYYILNKFPIYANFKNTTVT
jgi:hypothetical protein